MLTWMKLVGYAKMRIWFFLFVWSVMYATIYSLIFCCSEILNQQAPILSTFKQQLLPYLFSTSSFHTPPSSTIRDGFHDCLRRYCRGCPCLTGSQDCRFLLSSCSRLATNENEGWKSDMLLGEDYCSSRGYGGSIHACSGECHECF